MTEVGIAAGAQNLHPSHPVAPVLFGDDVLAGDRLEEAGPAGAGVELRVRGEEREPAADARVDALPLVVEQRPAEGPLGGLPSGDLELFAREELSPFGVRLFDSCHLNRADEVPGFIEDPNADCGCHSNTSARTPR